MKVIIFLLTVLPWLIADNASGGWTFTENSEGERQTRHIQNNRMKFTAPDHLIIFDLDKKMVSFANPNEKSYWMGTPAEFAAQAKKGLENIDKIIDRQLSAVPPGQRAAFKRSLIQQIKKQTGGPRPKVEIKPSDRSAKIAGHKVRKYDILFDGLLRQELWIAQDIRFGREFDVRQFGKMMRVFHSGLGQHSDESELWSPRVTKLLLKGWPLRTTDYDEDGSPEKTEVLKVEKSDLPDSAFELPGNYRRMSVSEIFGRDGG